MKKIIIPILAILLVGMLAPNVLASPAPPYTFSGEYTVNGDPCDGCKIEFRYMESTSDSGWKTTHTLEGWYQFTNKQFSDGDYYRPGDRVEVKFCNSDTVSECKQIIRFEGEAGNWINIQIESGSYSIRDLKHKTIVIRASESAVIVEKRLYTCSDGTKVDDKSDCKEGTVEWYHIIIGTLILVALALFESKYAWGRGFCGLVKYYVKKDQFSRALKMLKNAIEKARAGK